LTAVLAPLLAIILYPRANWLFALVLVGIAILILQSRFSEDPTPYTLANEIERLLNGTSYGRWDVDDFESQYIRDSRLKELWRKSMEIGGLPEEWVKLDEQKKERSVARGHQKLERLRKNPRRWAGEERTT